MNRWRAIAMVIALVVAACGGSGDGADDGGGDATTTTRAATDDGGADVTTTTTTPQASDAGGSADATATTVPGGDDPGDDEEEGTGPSEATVTIDGETFEFSTEGAIVAQCLTDLFGVFSVQLPLVDGGDGGISIVALHPDTDPEVVGEVNSVRVSIGDEDWVADEDDMMFESSDKLEAGMSQVDSVEIDGRTVRGTATFFLQSTLFVGDEVETATGSFEATCGEERTS